MKILGPFHSKALQRAAEGRKIYDAACQPDKTILQQAEFYQKNFSELNAEDTKAFIQDINGKFGPKGNHVTIQVMREFYLKVLQDNFISELSNVASPEQLLDLLHGVTPVLEHLVCAKNNSLEEQFLQAVHRACEKFEDKSEVSIGGILDLVNKSVEGSTTKRLLETAHKELSERFAIWKQKQVEAEEHKETEERELHGVRDQESAIAAKLDKVNQNLEEKLSNIIARPLLQDKEILHHYHSFYEEFEQTNQLWPKVNWMIDRIEFRVTSSTLNNLVVSMRDLSANMAKQQLGIDQNLTDAITQLAEQQRICNELIAKLGQYLEKTLDQQAEILSRLQLTPAHASDVKSTPGRSRRGVPK